MDAVHEHEVDIYDPVDTFLTNRSLQLNINQLHSLNTDAYEMAYRTPYIDLFGDTNGLMCNGMRPDQLAIWLVDERDKCCKQIIRHFKNMKIRNVTVNTIKTISSNPDIKNRDATKIIKQLKSAI